MNKFSALYIAYYACHSSYTTVFITVKIELGIPAHHQSVLFYTLDSFPQLTNDHWSSHNGSDG